LAYQEVRQYITGRILELGPAEGIMTLEMVESGLTPDLVEGSATLATELSRRYPNLDVSHQLFEDFEPKTRYDTIIMGHVLEHVIDPIQILRRYKNFLTPHSIHRQAAVEMGMLSDVTSLNEADIRHGHRRVYTPEAFQSTFQSSGFEILKFGGYWLKPLSNAQIQETWTEEMVRAFCAMGRKYPEISGEMYIVASVESGE